MYIVLYFFIFFVFYLFFSGLYTQMEIYLYGTWAWKVRREKMKEENLFSSTFYSTKKDSFVVSSIKNVDEIIFCHLDKYVDD